MNKITASTKLSKIVTRYQNDENVASFDISAYRGIITMVRVRMKEGDVLQRVFTGPTFSEVVIFRDTDYTLDSRRKLMSTLYKKTHLSQTEVGSILGLSQSFISAELRKLGIYSKRSAHSL